MKRRILSAALAVFMLLSALGGMCITSHATDPGVHLLNAEPNYVKLTGELTAMLAEPVTITNTGVKTLTFWFSVSEMTDPFYFAGTRFAFTTESAGSAGTDSFATNGTGSKNPQNHGLLITEPGDYFLTVNLNDSWLAWNYKEDCGGFESITAYQMHGYDQASYDATGSVKSPEASVALMGIFEGELDSEAAVAWSGDGKDLGSAAPTYEVIKSAPINYNNPPSDPANLTGLTFTKLVSPVTAPAVSGKEFKYWADEAGNRSVPYATDSLSAYYGAILTRFELWAKDADGKLVNEVPMNSEANELVVKLPSGDLGVTDGIVTVGYDANRATVEGGADGVISISFSEVAPDGTVATLKLTPTENLAGKVSFTITGKVETNGSDIDLRTANTAITVAGEQAGAYLAGESVALNKNDGESLPAEQKLWKGYVPLNNASGVTFVYRLEGIESPVVANRFWLTVDRDGREAYPTKWANNWLNKSDVTALTFEEDGYFFIYVNKFHFDNNSYTAVRDFNIFESESNGSGSSGDDRTNTNENATFALLAIIENSLAPTVNYYSEDGSELYASVTHEYSPAAGNGAEVFRGALADAAAIYLAAGLQTPMKEGEESYIRYDFLGWVDADGKAVTDIYTATDVYASWERVDTREHYDIRFVNYDGSVLATYSVPEGEVPEYKGETPKRESTETQSYKFIGWDAELSAVTGAATYTAQYEQTPRTYNVLFYAEDRTTLLGESLYIQHSGAATEPGTEKASDEQYDYTFAGWVDADGRAADVSKVTADMTVYATYEKSLRTFTVIFMDEEGEELKRERVEYGAAATAPTVTKPSDGHYDYPFAGWVDSAGNTVSIEEVRGELILYPTFTAQFKNPFTDIDMSRYYGDAVEYVVTGGIMNGTDKTLFSPDDSASRAMIVTVLWRAEGSPEPTGDNPFADVAAGRYYTKAVVWAYENGVVTGMSDTVFAPESPVTREQFVTILYRYADGVKGYDVSYRRGTSLDGYADKGETSLWAQTALKWATAEENGYLTGVPEGDRLYLKPADGTTRAQMATILYRFLTDEK